MIAPNRNLKIDVYKTTTNLALLHVKTHTQHKLRLHQPNASLQFVVRRHEPELISPVVPTPREVKPLSDITGEGVLFIEAEADITLKQYFREGQFGEVFHPPFPGFEQLLYEVPDYDGIFDSPLLHIQVKL